MFNQCKQRENAMNWIRSFDDVGMTDVPRSVARMPRSVRCGGR